MSWLQSPLNPRAEGRSCMRSRVVIAFVIACSSPAWPLAAQPSEQEAPPPAAEGDAPQLPEDDPAASSSDAAEAQPEPEVSVAPEGEPDEIVVTAQKRAQRVQDVPLSISVVGEFQLERQQVHRVADLARIAPSLE